jgi:hypothetical protein
MPNKKVTLSNWVDNQLKLDTANAKEKSSKNNYLHHQVIGKGGFGKVWRV